MNVPCKSSLTGRSTSKASKRRCGEKRYSGFNIATKALKNVQFPPSHRSEVKFSAMNTTRTTWHKLEIEKTRFGYCYLPTIGTFCCGKASPALRLIQWYWRCAVGCVQPDSSFSTLSFFTLHINAIFHWRQICKIMMISRYQESPFKWEVSDTLYSFARLIKCSRQADIQNSVFWKTAAKFSIKPPWFCRNM